MLKHKREHKSQTQTNSLVLSFLHIVLSFLHTEPDSWSGWNMARQSRSKADSALSSFSLISETYHQSRVKSNHPTELYWQKWQDCSTVILCFQCMCVMHSIIGNQPSGVCQRRKTALVSVVFEQHWLVHYMWQSIHPFWLRETDNCWQPPITNRQTKYVDNSCN